MTQVETNIFVRPLSGDDIPLMETFLYEAIFVPEGVANHRGRLFCSQNLPYMCGDLANVSVIMVLLLR